MRTTPVWGSATAPLYLAICWKEGREDGEDVTVEAYLCREHRDDVSLKHPGARGCGRLGYSCDLCEGRQPKTISGE